MKSLSGSDIVQLQQRILISAVSVDNKSYGLSAPAVYFAQAVSCRRRNSPAEYRYGNNCRRIGRDIPHTAALYQQIDFFRLFRGRAAEDASRFFRPARRAEIIKCQTVKHPENLLTKIGADIIRPGILSVYSITDYKPASARSERA